MYGHVSVLRGKSSLLELFEIKTKTTAKDDIYNDPNLFGHFGRS